MQPTGAFCPPAVHFSDNAVYMANRDARAALICFECGACTDWTTYSEKNLPICLILDRLTLKVRCK